MLTTNKLASNTSTAQRCGDSPCAAAHSELYVREVMPHANDLKRRAQRLMFNDADAEDLTQETLLRAYAGFRQLRPNSNVRAWLFRIQTNTWISNHRARLCRPDECLTDRITDSQLARDLRHRPDSTHSAEAAALQGLPDDRIKAALQSLDEAQRVVVYLCDVEGLPYKAIAERTGMPLGTVMSRIHRGRKALRHLLGDSGASRTDSHRQ